MPKLKVLDRFLSIFLLFLILSEASVSASDKPFFTVSGRTGQPDLRLQLSDIESLGVKTISSVYFDEALGFKNTRLRVVSFKDLLGRWGNQFDADAVLLNCFDDYQGIVSKKDILRYDLHLATQIQVQPEYSKPDWLNPLLIIVPDGAAAPRMERFLTGNIQELKLINMNAYYAPLTKVIAGDEAGRQGLKSFQDNCLFCHSLVGIGGSKGIPLLQAYNFLKVSEDAKFRKDFENHHGKRDPDNIGQFIDSERLKAIALFLKTVQKGD